MSLTINHIDGKFTCEFIPDGEASVQINSASPVKVNVDITGPADQKLNRDNEDNAQRGEAISSPLEEVSREEDTSELGEVTSSVVEESSIDAEKYRSENMDPSALRG